jgi:hypothetical protein
VAGSDASGNRVTNWPDTPTARFLIFWVNRRSELCDGGFGAETNCPDAEQRETGDGTQIECERCDHCPLDQLDDSLARTGTGRAVQEAFKLDRAIGWGADWSLDSLPAETWRLLQLIRYERDRQREEVEAQARGSMKGR